MSPRVSRSPCLVIEVLAASSVFGRLFGFLQPLRFWPPVRFLGKFWPPLRFMAASSVYGRLFCFLPPLRFLAASSVFWPPLRRRPHGVSPRPQSPPPFRTGAFRSPLHHIRPSPCACFLARARVASVGTQKTRARSPPPPEGSAKRLMGRGTFGARRRVRWSRRRAREIIK